MYSKSAEKKKSKSEVAILKAAKELYWKHGISRVSVEEISSEAEISKMTFYRYFKNKFEVASVILQEMATEGIDTYRSIMSSNVSYPEKLETLMKYQREQAAQMSIEFISDLYKSEQTKDIVQMLNENSKVYDLEMRGDFQKAIDEGYIRSGITVDFIMHMLQVVRKESGSAELHNCFESAEDLAVVMTDFFFHGILSEKKG